jgi:hypothetical protein
MMLTGLEILLDRMKTNPEEFLKDDHVPYEGESFGGKWSDLVNYAWRIATEEERQMLEDARREFYRDDFNERVMKRLAGEEVKEELSPYIVKGSTANTVLVGGGGSGGTWTDPRAIYGSQAAQVIKNPIQHAAAQQNMATQNSMLSGNGSTGVQGVVQGGYGQAQVRQEGAAIGVDPSFWGGIIASGKGKLW